MKYDDEPDMMMTISRESLLDQEHFLEAYDLVSQELAKALNEEDVTTCVMRISDNAIRTCLACEQRGDSVEDTSNLALNLVLAQLGSLSAWMAGRVGWQARRMELGEGGELEDC